MNIIGETITEPTASLTAIGVERLADLLVSNHADETMPTGVYPELVVALEKEFTGSRRGEQVVFDNLRELMSFKEYARAYGFPGLVDILATITPGYEALPRHAAAEDIPEGLWLKAEDARLAITVLRQIPESLTFNYDGIYGISEADLGRTDAYISVPQFAGLVSIGHQPEEDFALTGK